MRCHTVAIYSIRATKSPTQEAQVQPPPETADSTAHVNSFRPASICKLHDPNILAELEQCLGTFVVSTITTRHTPCQQNPQNCLGWNWFWFAAARRAPCTPPWPWKKLNGICGANAWKCSGH